LLRKLLTLSETIFSIIVDTVCKIDIGLQRLGLEGEQHCGTGIIWEIFKHSGYSPHSILLLNTFASIGAIVSLARFQEFS